MGFSWFSIVMGVPQNGWFISWGKIILLKWMITRGTSIYGSPQMITARQDFSASKSVFWCAKSFKSTVSTVISSSLHMEFVHGCVMSIQDCSPCGLFRWHPQLLRRSAYLQELEIGEEVRSWRWNSVGFRWDFYGDLPMISSGVTLPISTCCFFGGEYDGLWKSIRAKSAQMGHDRTTARNSVLQGRYPQISGWWIYSSQASPTWAKKQ